MCGELDTKLKNSTIKNSKFLELLEKTVPLLLIFMIFISISLYENLRNLKYNYNEIKFVENKILDEKKNLQNMENSNTDISNTDWINYSLWIKECAGFSNMFIYNHTNNLEILSLTPQRELDIISRNFTIAQNNKNYDKFVKFIIINKSEGTFLTNDIQNIDLIKKILKYSLKKMVNYIIMCQIEENGLI